LDVNPVLAGLSKTSHVLVLVSHLQLLPYGIVCRSVHWKHEVYTGNMNIIHWKHEVYTGNMNSVHWKHEVYTGNMNSVHWKHEYYTLET